MSIATRLRSAALDKYNTLLDFQKEMAGRKVKGSTYPTVHGYVNGLSTPSVEFLESAADLLGVRKAWLILGEGERTELEARMKQGVPELSDEERRRFERIEAAVREDFSHFDRVPAFAQMILWHCITVLGASIFERTPEPPARISETDPLDWAAITAARTIGTILNGGFLLMQLMPERDMPEDQLGFYVVSMCQALLQLAPPLPYEEFEF